MDLWWIVLAVVLLVVVSGVAMSARVVQQYERGLVFRFGRLRGERPRARADADRAGRGPDAEGQHADHHDAGAGAGRHHPGQRDGPGGRGGLLPGDRSGAGHRQRAGLHVRGVPGRADVAAVGDRQERSGRPAEQPGAAESGPGVDDRQSGVGLGDPHRPGRDQGCRPAGGDEAVDVPAGRGRTGTARPGDLRRWRTAGVGEARRRRRRRWPTPRVRCSSGCWRRSCRSRPRRTRRWCCRSRSSCCVSWSTTRCCRRRPRPRRGWPWRPALPPRCRDEAGVGSSTPASAPDGPAVPVTG